MKRFLTLAIFATILTGAVASHTSSPQRVAIKIENIDAASRNILIHSIAFQKYNHVQYAAILSNEFSTKKLDDTHDDLISVN